MKKILIILLVSLILASVTQVPVQAETTYDRTIVAQPAVQHEPIDRDIAINDWVVLGGVQLSKDTKMSEVTIFHETTAPALHIRGSAVEVQSSQILNIQGLVGVLVFPMPPSKEQIKLLFRDNLIVGTPKPKANVGLSLDARLTSDSEVSGNTFVNLKCGILIAIDVVFSHLPPEERLAAYEKLVARLTAENEFHDVNEPVCGGRGSRQ